MPMFLRKSVGLWSAGTRVEVLAHPDDFEGDAVNHGYATIRVLAGDRPVIDIEADYLVERGRKRAKVGEGTEDS
jgi:hypothetical protein